MKEYPKVPSHDHPVLFDIDEDTPADEFTPEYEGGFWESDDLYVLEKFDGGNARIILYEDRFREEYTEEVLSLDPSDGDLIFGSKRVLRGTHNIDPSEVDAAFDNFVEYLNTEIDIEALRDIQSNYGPLVLFVENMVPHTLDYTYESDPPPVMIGFDIFMVRDGPLETPPNPYNETFEGFMDIETAWDCFREIGIQPAHIYDGPGNIEFTDDESFVPQSSVASIQAEGIVLRSDEYDRRVKFVTDDFKEKLKQSFGLRPDQAENGEEYIVANYCTNARIRKEINKMVIDEGREFGLHLNDDLYPRVVDDIWDEHYHEIKDMRLEFTPAEIKPLVAKRCIEELRKLKKTAELNDRDPTEVWADFT